ncbi:type IX secretion system sortase PorU [Flavobacterium sp. MFBS3-15]|uniref:type IX secretion system sortase PorU n=1 Tax=Flavobacterium sp. MFBS3-15 TaxID=2989816 RepID=UPI00278C6FD3|nr:type IX secretion system sortase PorU [Flavobacterium sp. MFBS3-15]
MMKKRILFMLLLVPSLAFAQQSGDVVLEWTDNVKSQLGTSLLDLPNFKGQSLDYDDARKALFFRSSIPVGAAANPNSITVTNIVYENIIAARLGTLSVAALPSSVNAKVTASKARSQWYATIELSPIIKDGSGYKRVKSFSYSFSFDAARSNFRDAADFDEISNSVLASGNWYRFYVEKSGVYKVTRSFLQSLGMSVNVDPRTIKIYGNGGRMAPLLNSTDYPSDLAENAITVIGEEDGSFGSGDYILFYAEGVDNWNDESGTHSNLFSDKSYYYVTAGGVNGKRIATQPQPTANPNITTSAFDAYVYHEKDLVNIARLGRKWHGEQFNVENEQSFDFSIPDIEPGPATVVVSAAAFCETPTSMAVSVNGQAAGTISYAVTPDASEARDGSLTANFTPSGGTITVALAYNNGGVPASNAWLDYIIIKAKRKLQGNGKQFRFQYNDAAANIGTIQYNVSNASGISEVWDITNIYDASKILNDGQGQFSFKSALGEVRKYIAVVPSDYYTPLREGRPKVANQNLKGTIFKNSQGAFEDIDYLIVTPAKLNAEAEKLANYHRTNSGLNVKVVNLENIYHEFSSGKQDIAAIRNFIKYIYLNASAESERIKYVNLFGDASFDYKDRIPGNTNIVPAFHGINLNPGSSDDNYSTVRTFLSDDFYGLMDPNEGRIPYSGNGTEKVDIAIGRMLVSDREQASQMINKVFEYRSVESYGRWRNEYIMITDDLEDNGGQFVPEMENVAEELMDRRPFVNIRKIHSDAYVQQASAGGQRYPEAKEQILRAINYGALVVNYLGHGGEDGMASERLFEKTDAQSLTNRYKYPLFITATCELTKFDNPLRPTVGEYIYWNPSGGAIAMVTTTRSIYTSAAYDLNEVFSGKLYDFNNVGVYPTMAEALMQTKQVLSSSSIRHVTFIGDPALKMTLPEPNIVLTEINDVPVAQSTDVLQSLAYVKLAGQVTNEAGSLLGNYNGELEVTIFDKQMSRVTLDNDHLNVVTPFDVLGETIFRGNATVTNGKFEFGFVVPRDIRIPVGNGRVSFYSKKNNVLEDHYGYNAAIKIGGVNTNAVADNTGPKVRLYMNDETFISGGITNDSPILLAFLEDEHGINTASGIGHDIIGILDGDETNPFVMNDYYETELDDYTRGIVRFPFSNLEKGLHTLTFKAWDVYNNLVTAEIQFVVTGDDVLKLEKVLNYPNPFVSYTEFWFTHNRPFEPLDVQVQILTVTGKIVKTINQQVSTDGFLCREIKWDGRDDFGDRIGKGVYIYKLTVRSSTSNKTAEKYEKLVLL